MSKLVRARATQQARRASFPRAPQASASTTPLTSKIAFRLAAFFAFLMQSYLVKEAVAEHVRGGQQCTARWRRRRSGACDPTSSVTTTAGSQARLGAAVLPLGTGLRRGCDSGEGAEGFRAAERSETSPGSGSAQSLVLPRLSPPYPAVYGSHPDRVRACKQRGRPLHAAIGAPLPAHPPAAARREAGRVSWLCEGRGGEWEWGKSRDGVGFVADRGLPAQCMCCVLGRPLHHPNTCPNCRSPALGSLHYARFMFQELKAFQMMPEVMHNLHDCTQDRASQPAATTTAGGALALLHSRASLFHNSNPPGHRRSGRARQCQGAALMRLRAPA